MDTGGGTTKRAPAARASRFSRACRATVSRCGIIRRAKETAPSPVTPCGSKAPCAGRDKAAQAHASALARASRKVSGARRSRARAGPSPAAGGRGAIGGPYLRPLSCPSSASKAAMGRKVVRVRLRRGHALCKGLAASAVVNRFEVGPRRTHATGFGHKNAGARA